jgi:hypothetical protein
MFDPSMEPNKFCFKGRTLTVLEKGQDYDVGLPDHGQFYLDFSRAATKLTLVDFPPAEYKLTMNGSVHLTSNQNVFDFSKVDAKWPHIDNGVINFGRVDNVKLTFLATIDLSTKDYTMRYTTKDGDIDQTFNFWSYGIHINHPTESIELVFQNAAKEPGTCQLFLNGEMAWDFKVPTGSNRIRVKCRNPERKFEGGSNPFMTEKMNRNSINMSRVDHLRASTKNCRLLTYAQWEYVTWILPEMRRMFA